MSPSAVILDAPQDIVIQIISLCDPQGRRGLEQSCHALRNLIATNAERICLEGNVTLPIKAFRDEYPDFPYREVALFAPFDEPMAGTRKFKTREIFPGNTADIALRPDESVGVRCQAENYGPYPKAVYHWKVSNEKLICLVNAIMPSSRVSFSGWIKSVDSLRKEQRILLLKYRIGEREMVMYGDISEEWSELDNKQSCKTEMESSVAFVFPHSMKEFRWSVQLVLPSEERQARIAKAIMTNEEIEKENHEQKLPRERIFIMGPPIV